VPHQTHGLLGCFGRIHRDETEPTPPALRAHGQVDSDDRRRTHAGEQALELLARCVVGQVADVERLVVAAVRAAGGWSLARRWPRSKPGATARAVRMIAARPPLRALL